MAKKLGNLIGLLVILGLVGAPAGTGLARPLTAPPVRIYVDADASGADNGTSWANAYQYLQDALDQTNSSGGTDFEIWVAEGVYYPDEDSDGDHTNNDASEVFRIAYDNVQIYGGFAGGETSREQRDWKINLTILSGDIDGNDTNADGDYIAEYWSHISGTNANRVVLMDGTTNEDLTTATVLDGFVITASDGAGLLGGGLLCYGGGLAPSGSSSPVLRNLLVQGNRSGNGGGIGLDADNDGEASPIITNVWVLGNFASANGGGMATASSGAAEAVIDPLMTNMTFSENYAVTSGGGLSIYTHLGSSSPQLTNVVFYSNIADNNGGGIQFNANEGTINADLTNLAFYGNDADAGGAIFNAQGGTGVSTLDINNSILWGDSATPDDEIDGITSTITIEHSDVEGCGGSSSWVASCGTNGGGNIDANPLYRDAGSGDLDLLPGSPAIDDGDQTLLPLDVPDLDGNGDTGERIPLDRDMLPRVQDGEVDMGAFESGEYQTNPGFYVPSGGKWYLKNDQADGWSNYVTVKFAGLSGALAVAGDWDQDGISTPGFYVPSQGKWYLKNDQLNGWSNFVTVRFAGPTGAQPVVGDWDFNGTTTIGFYVPSQGKWYLKNDLVHGWSNFITVKFAGLSGAQAVAADWDGEGWDTIGFYVPSQGKWYLKETNANGWGDVTMVRFGGPGGEIAVAGDWDEDHEHNIGMYVPSGGKWYLKYSFSHGWSAYNTVKFAGPSGAQPVTGDWK